jgi:predicted metalloprotease with PDZ domain
VTLATVAPWLEGDARVVVVASEDAAHTAGLRAGDHVISVNDEAVRDAPGALRLLDACGDACVLSYVDEDAVRRTARITP